ncbi:hypothetical protein C6A85_01440, partial [Mycobacterium sp. ITM-2017-0098]
YLAECLLLGSGTPATDRHEVAAAIAQAAENVPYYIQHLVAAATSCRSVAGVPLPNSRHSAR